MALDTLEVFGTEYTNVAGFKATDDNDTIKTYIRPQGTLSISENGDGIDVTAYASVDVDVSGGAGAFVDTVEQLVGGGDHHIITGVDISSDTVTAEHLEQGYTAHDSSGNAVLGTLVPGGGGSSLPLAYQQVEYIDGSASGAVINTGVHPTEARAISIKIMPLAATGDSLIGTKGISDNSDWRLFNYTQKFYFDCSSSRMNFGTFQTNVVYEINFGNFYVISSDGQSQTNSPLSFSEIPYDIYINGWSGTGTSQARWYYVKIYTAGRLIRDYVPCYRIADNVVGLYDLVTEQFYSSVGNGQFIAGPDVNDPQQMLNIILGE